MGQLEELATVDFIDSRAKEIMKEFGNLLQQTGVFGYTIGGPYVTLRFGDEKHLVTVALVVVSISDTDEEVEDEEDK